jgi:hypothetical protein
MGYKIGDSVKMVSFNGSTTSGVEDFFTLDDTYKVTLVSGDKLLLVGDDNDTWWINDTDVELVNENVPEPQKYHSFSIQIDDNAFSSDSIQLQDILQIISLMVK